MPNGRRPDVPPLGTYGDRPTIPGHEVPRRAARRAFWRWLKRLHRAMTGSRSSALCMLARASRVTVGVGAQLTAHVTNVFRCGSVWICPLCAPVIREGRAVEIDLAASVALAEGMGVEFVSMTTRHHRPDPLVDRLTPVSRAFAECLKGRTWSMLRDDLGYVGLIRAVEVTWNETNGWHPHVHALLFFERSLTPADRSRLESFIFGRWSGYLARKKLGTITEANGVDVRPVTDSDGIASYLTKVESGWSAGHELARGDVKTSTGSLTPFGMLEHMAMTGEMIYRQQWCEYERATKGKRALLWSRGLRGRLLGDDVGQSDEELAASEGSDVILVQFLIAAKRWNELTLAGLDGDVLSECERIAAKFIDDPTIVLDPENPLTMEMTLDDFAR